jgi:hypothetical protein
VSQSLDDRTILLSWLDAARLALEAGLSKAQVTRAFQRTQVEVIPGSTVLGLYTLVPRGGRGGVGKQATLQVRSAVGGLYRIERAEVLLSGLARALQWIDSHTNPGLVELCDRLHCDTGPYADVDRRWEKLGYRVGAEAGYARYLPLDDRPACKWCGLPVGTGHDRRIIHNGCFEHAKAAARRLAPSPNLKSA